jgi:NADPH-dependent ferric siderophore reductase
VTQTVILPWRFFHTTVREVKRLSPSFLRVTLTGDDLDLFADNGFDQRIKLIPPLPGHGHDHLPTGEDWYTRWSDLPDEHRNPIRTYTVRAVRPELREVDLDMVLHGVHGPASRWADAAGPGSTVCLMGPNAQHDGVHGGIDFRPPAQTERLLLGGDETAVPAISSILACLPAHATGEALLEVPATGDELEIHKPDGVRVTWLPRDGAAHGERLIPAMRAATERLLGGTERLLGGTERLLGGTERLLGGTERLLGGAATARVPEADASQGGASQGGASQGGASQGGASQGGASEGGQVELEDVDVDNDVLWEVPEPVADVSRFYAWLAGEAAVIKTLRRHLVAECGVDRRSVAFMGYWRLGRAEDN